MKIELTFIGCFSGTIKTIVIDDMTSPNNGYTQKYADQVGNDYASGRAFELFGGQDFWVWQSSRYVTT